MRLFWTGLCAGVVLLAGSARAIEPVNPRREPGFRASGAIHGYLVDPSGQGLSGIVALCTQQGGTMTETETVAMRRGRFDFDNVLPGTYLLRVKSVGPVVTDLVPPADRQVRVVAKRVQRPHLVAMPGPRTP